jgi:hypothetical protein
MNVEFNAEELEILRSVLAEYVTDLHEEVTHTDTREYKEQLRAEEAILRRLQQKLQAVPQ